MTHFVHPREERLLWPAYAGAAVIATYICGIAQQCNNFHIFRSAFGNLLAQRDLYAAHPDQHWDLFKYSPTFALFFAPLSAAPFALGLLAWNLLNVMMVYHAVRRVLPGREGTLALALLYPGLVATLDGTQSNGLVAATIVIAWLGLERAGATGRWIAALAIAAGALVKLFPAAALSFGLMHRGRLRFFAVFAVVLVVLVAPPLLVAPPASLVAQYASWFSLERVDALDRGASVMRLLHHVAGYEGPNWPVQLAGTVVLLAPLARRACREDRARRRDFLCSLLVYAVIFNHKAEQPSFVIALVGIVVWYAGGLPSRARPPSWRTAITVGTIASMVPMFVAAVAPTLGNFADLPILAAAACATMAWVSMQSELLGLGGIPAALRRRLTPLQTADVVAEE